MSTNMNTIINANTSALKGTDPFKAFQAFVSNFFIDALKNDIIDDEVFEKINTMFKSPSVYKALKTDIRPRTTTKTKRGTDFTLHQWSHISPPDGAGKVAAAPSAPVFAPPAPPVPAAASKIPAGYQPHPSSPGWFWNPQTNDVRQF